MHVEMSLDAEAVESPPESDVKPTDTQTISGSQVAAAFARIEKSDKENKSGTMQTLVISVAAVLSVVSLYLIFVLVL